MLDQWDDDRNVAPIDDDGAFFIALLLGNNETIEWRHRA
jgi:hypothetical protein